jgi:hypothetical protein
MPEAAAPLVDAAVRLADELGDAFLAARLDLRLAQGSRCQPRGHLACLGAAHPIRDGEERRRADEGVLVPAALPPGVRFAGSLAESQSG